MKPCRIIHIPVYPKNPYQSLLLKNLSDIGFDVRYGIRKVYFSFIDVSILFNLIKNYKVDIIHLHWQHLFLLYEKKILMIFKCLLFIFQLLFLKILGVTADGEITKKKAGRLIELALKNNHKGKFN